MSTTGFHQKIVGLDRLRQIVREARSAGQRIVQCHGCFDIVHPGHIRYLQFARHQGDVLIVSLTGDRAGGRGGRSPYVPEDLRAENLAALVFVDWVYIDPNPTAEQLLADIRPDIYVKGREYEQSTDADFLAEKAVVEQYGGRLIFSSGEIAFSTASLSERRFDPQEPGRSQRLAVLAERHAITRGALLDRLERFRNLRVAVVGDVLIDRYVFCDATDVASESPMLSLTQQAERTFAGGAAIVARHVTALGGRAFLLSAGAEDEATRSVRDLLEGEGVETHFLPARSVLVEKTRFLVEEDKLLKVDAGERMPLDSVAEREAAMILEQQAKIADAVILCDFGYGMITGGLLSRVLPTLRHNVRILAADGSGGRSDLLAFKHVDLFCPTERELRLALNDHETGLSAAAWTFLDRTQGRHLLVTLEKRGLVVFERRSQDRHSPEWSGRLKSDHLPSFAAHAVDRLGCGDALLAAATMSLAAGAGLMEAAVIGNAAAALEITLLGNHPISQSTLRDWIAARSEWHHPDVPTPPAGVLEYHCPTA